MNRFPLSLSPLLLLLLVVGCQESGGSSSGGTIDTVAARTLLRSAIERTSGRSYHAVSELEIDMERTRIEGDFETDRMNYTVRRAGIPTKQFRVIAAQSWRSTDSGATWTRDTISEGVSTAMLIVGPIMPRVKLAEESTLSVVGREVVDGDSTIHIRMAHTPPVDFWIRVQGGDTLVRRLRSGFAANDVSGISTTTFSRYGEQMNIGAP